MASLTFKRKAEAIPFNVYQTKESALLHSLIAGIHDFPGESSWLLKGFIWKKIILASVPLAIPIFEKKRSASFDQLWFTEYSLETWHTEDNTSLWIQPRYYGVYDVTSFHLYCVSIVSKVSILSSCFTLVAPINLTVTQKAPAWLF